MLSRFPVLFLFIILWGLPLGLFAFSPALPGTDTISSPEIKCISVLPNGYTVIDWSLPADPNNSFNSYHIYTSSSSSGPFTILDSIFTYATTNYTHTGAAANNNIVYYYIKSRSGNNGKVFSPASTTTNSIFLKVSNPGTGTAILNWNAIASPNPSGSNIFYSIYREYPVGIWTKIDSVQSLFYIDTIAICSAYINYRIGISNSSGCTSISNAVGANFKDLLAPSVPLLDSASVDILTGIATMGWEPSKSKDTRGYIIYKYNSNAWTPVDTVYGINTISYVYPASVASSGPEEFRIASFDSCNNVSPMGGIHKTIFLQLVTNSCSGTNLLSWNSYGGWNVGAYRIYVSVNGGSYTFLSSTSSTSFSHAGIISASYCYYVRAIDAAGKNKATSSVVCVISNVPKKPTYTYLKAVAVTGPSSVQVRCIVDSNVFVKAIQVMRSDDPAGPFITIGTVMPVGGSAIFNDNTAKTSVQSYYYKVISLDSCGKAAVTSNLGRTLLLTVVSNEDMTNTLSWNNYQQWLGNVTGYNIYRAVGGVFDPNPVGFVPYGTTTFTDDISAFYDNKGQFSYYVIAIEGTGNPYMVQDSSRSNIGYAVQEHTLFVPNAFAPTKVNMIFQPKGAFLDKSEYEFYVFDRWGGRVFETNDYNTGWDGKIDGGKLGEEGIYVYLIKFKTTRGQHIEKKGVVMLLR